MAVAANTILDAVQARLGNISQANGYYSDVKKIERSTVKPFKGYDLPYCHVWPGEVESVRDLHRTDKRTLSVNVELYTKTLDDPLDEQAGKLAWDIVTALDRATTDPETTDSVSGNLGGLVQDWIFSGYTYGIGEGQAPWLFVLVQFQAVWLCPNNDMTTIET